MITVFSFMTNDNGTGNRLEPFVVGFLQSRVDSGDSERVDVCGVLQHDETLSPQDCRPTVYDARGM